MTTEETNYGTVAPCPGDCSQTGPHEHIDFPEDETPAAPLVGAGGLSLPMQFWPGRDDALRHLAKAKELLAQFDRSARGVDVHVIRAGVAHELEAIQAALGEGRSLSLPQSLDGVTGDREGKVRRDAPATSRRAARRITVKSGTQRASILMALNAERLEGLTDFELSSRLRMLPNSVRPRRGELRDLGYVRPVQPVDGTKGTKTHRGEEWTLWTVTDVGHALAVSLVNAARPVRAVHAGEQLALD